MRIKHLIEAIENLLYESKEHIYYLHEMSQPQGKVRQRVRDLSEEIISHLIKIILYGNELSDTVPHWCAEIDAWMDKCTNNKIKRNKKDSYPTSKELITWLTDYYSKPEDIEGLRYFIEKQYVYEGHYKRENVSNEKLYECITKVLEQLCPLVAQKMQTRTDIQDIISKYILG